MEHGRPALALTTSTDGLFFWLSGCTPADDRKLMDDACDHDKEGDLDTCASMSLV